MKKSINLFLLLPCFFLFIQKSNAQAGDDAKMMRFPAVHDNRVVFSYAGDLYEVAKTGGVARKLTSDVGYEMFARFSPDGKKIAFTGQYDGNTEVYVMNSDGGIPKRVTYTATLNRDDIGDRMGPNNIVMTWKDNEHIIYRSRKQSFNDFQGALYMADTAGGLSTQLPFSIGGFCSYSADGKQIAMNRVFREFRTWKYYRGGMADDIWIYDFASGNWTNLTNNDAQDIEPMWSGSKIYFLSDRDRTMNLFVYDLNSKQTRKLTNFTDYDIKFASLGDQDIVFEKGGELYDFSLQTEQVNKIPVQINDDNLNGKAEWVDASKYLEGWDLAPDGSRLAYAARGDVWTVPATTGITRNITQTGNAHEREVNWSPDGKWLAYISDASGEDEIYIRPQKGDGAATRVTTNGDNYKYHMVWSPDSKKILWSDRHQTLYYVDVNSKQITTIDHSDSGEYIFYKWSPDSKWVAYVRPEFKQFNRAFLYSLTTKTSTPVTDGWYAVTEPTFTSDGKYLMLTSDRDFNPTFSNVEFEIAYTNLTKLYIIPLAKTTPSPLAPKDDEVKAAADTAKAATPSTKKSASKNSKAPASASSASKDITVDLDGIANRLVALPVDPAQYQNLESVDGKIYYLRQKTGDPSSTLLMYSFDDRKETELGAYDNYEISADGKKMGLTKDNNYWVIDLPSSKIMTDKQVDLSNMKFWVNRHDEWMEIFNECWRQMRDFFYTPNMNGVDWNAMKQKYGALVPYVNTRADLTYIIGEMIGELSIGHSYVGGGDEPEVKKIKTGLLGAQLTKDASGYYKITKILNGANWSDALRSPLTEIGLNVKAGDFILAVDGNPTNQMTDIYQSLVGKADKQVELTVNDKSSMDGSRKIIVTPIGDEAQLYYYNWVEHNIHYVDSASGGKAGYLHIPNMGVDGLNEFIKHFYPQVNRQALIIDDRGNGGGFVSGLVAERMNRQLAFFDNQRNVIGAPDPQMNMGPKVLLVDKYSASDGDIIAYRWKKYGIGKVIGTRTWGGVTGIRNALPTMDGGFIEKPEFGIYNESGWIVEGHGVDPDIVVDNDPALVYKGIDQQLNKAIDVIMDELKTQTKTVPPTPAGPDKSH